MRGKCYYRTINTSFIIVVMVTMVTHPEQGRQTQTPVEGLSSPHQPPAERGREGGTEGGREGDTHLLTLLYSYLIQCTYPHEGVSNDGSLLLWVSDRLERESDLLLHSQLCVGGDDGLSCVEPLSCIIHCGGGGRGEEGSVSEVK